MLESSGATLGLDHGVVLTPVAPSCRALIRKLGGTYTTKLTRLMPFVLTFAICALKHQQAQCAPHLLIKQNARVVKGTVQAHKHNDIPTRAFNALNELPLQIVILEDGPSTTWGDYLEQRIAERSKCSTGTEHAALSKLNDSYNSAAARGTLVTCHCFPSSS